MTVLAFFTRSTKSVFFQAVIHFTIFNAFISEFGAYLAQNNMAQEQPCPRVLVKKKSHLDKLLSDGIMTSRIHGLAAESGLKLIAKMFEV